MTSLGDHLRAILPHLGGSLLSPEGTEAVLAVGDRLPAGLGREFGFECRLGGSPSRPDFLLTVDRAGGGRAVLASEDRLGAHCPLLPGHPAWRRIRQFASAWAEPGTILDRGAGHVQLGFGLDGPADRIPVPSFTFGPRPMVREARGGRGPATLTILDAGARTLTGEPFPGRRRARLLTVLEALPPGGAVFRAGFLMSRREPVTRLCISGLGAGEVLPFLHRAGWTGSGSSLIRLLEDVGSPCDAYRLDLGLADQVLPEVGIECCLHPFGSLRTRLRWAEFLARLVERGLCLQAERDALLGYGGLSRPRARTPGLAAALLGGRAGCFYRRMLSHVDLVLDPAAPPAARACLTAVETRLIRSCFPGTKESPPRERGAL